jgi:hypothetical protein
MMSDAWFRQKRPPLWISPRILRKYYADFLLPDTVQDTAANLQSGHRRNYPGEAQRAHSHNRGGRRTRKDALGYREFLRATTGHPIIGRGRLTGFQARSNRIGMSDATTRRP